MNLLLDTHIWIWSLRYPEKLNRTVLRRLMDVNTEMYLSPVSIWEAHHMARRGKVRLNGSFSDWLDRASAQVPLREAPFNFAVALEASRIQLPQMDLGDIWIAATALVYELPGDFRRAVAELLLAEDAG